METNGGQPAVSDPVLRQILALGPLQDRSEKISQLIGMPIEEYLDADQQAHHYEPDLEARRGFKAIMLAPNIHIYDALMRGERVPWWKLDLDEGARFKLRPGHESLTRVSLDDFNDVRG